ncbi:MAG TPA: DUF72 domain-containing protein [Polyangiaceae bacterium]|nr:DUF72 domain-containing protein [Polyangiaceae bacterium]
MAIRTGTSGFSYKEWKGLFYPEDLPDKKMLSFYSTRLGTVEINNTFYRMPKPELVAAWAAEVGPDFRFVLKAPQRITHRERLVGSEESLSRFFQAAGVLGDRLGAILFQLPPFEKKDVGKLAAFLALLPAGTRAAFEFRHPSWFEEDTYAALRERNAALVGGDAEDAAKSPPLVPTASFGYLRLRADEYTDGGLEDWAKRILAQPWKEAFVFLKHELRGPEFAEKLGRALGAA